MITNHFENRSVFFALLAAAMIFTSCDESPKTAKMNFFLTDAPAAYNAVNVDIQSIRAHSDQNGWVNVQLSNPGVYNLLDFSNGLDTLIASADLPSGKISQLRLILGSNNTIDDNGTIYPLSTPSGLESGIKLQVHTDLVGGVTYDIWLDFDANRSITKQGYGSYSLKPVIRAYTQATTGAITGIVIPAASTPYVMAVSGSDTLGVQADANGHFLIQGVPPAVYDVTFYPQPGFQQQTVAGVSVSVGVVIDMGTITINP
jgi:hypothetical protein